MTFAGFPITIECDGTSKFTNVNGAIRTSSPIFIFPTITEFVPIQTLSPILGHPFLFPLFSLPLVHPAAILIFLPKTASELIVICPA